MASDRQIAANRLNARKSTGPKTDRGRSRTRRNAIKHGLTARTVVEVFEDDAEFRTFARGVISAFRPTSPMHHELTHRLAALLWRLRRAQAIETGLLGIQGKLQRDIRVSRDTADETQQKMLALLGLGDSKYERTPGLMLEQQRTEAKARAFLRLCNLSGDAFDRLTRYETSIWRQVVQLLFLRDGMTGTPITKPHGAKTTTPSPCETNPISTRLPHRIVGC